MSILRITGMLNSKQEQKMSNFSSDGILKYFFTLLELLIVIAIITILASLLLPYLAKMKEKSTSIVCLNNLKQLGHMLHSYADDYNGYLPKNYYMRADGIIQRWDMSLDNQLNSKKRKIFLCPVSSERHGQFFSTGWHAESLREFYGDWNNCYIPNGISLRAYLSVGDVSCIKIGQILKPSLNVLLLDRKVGVVLNLGVNAHGWPFIDDQNENTGRIGYYHSYANGVNTVWADGHSSWKKGGGILNSNFTVNGN